MSKSPRHIIFLVAVTIMLAFGSCASRRKAMLAEPKHMEWITAHMDIEAELNGTSYPNLKGQLRMRRDSVVWASVSALGMEVMRVKMTSDSVWIINRMEKSYLSEPIALVAYALDIPVSYALVQTMLLDNPNGFAPKENQVVELNRKEMKGVSAKIKYSDIKLNEPSSFPCKITDKMERMVFVRRKEAKP